MLADRSPYGASFLVGSPAFRIILAASCIDLPVEYLDDLSREILGHGNAEPAFKCVIGQVLSHGRYIRQSRQAGRGGHRQGTDLATPDLWNRIGRGCKLHVHLTVDNIRQGECDATIWHVNHVDAGHRLEEFSRQMTDRADAL